MTKIQKDDHFINPYDDSCFDNLSAEIIWVDRAMARHLRDTCAFERQRNIEDRNVTRLGGEMRRGWFIAGTPIFVAVLPDNSMRLLNGNHTLEAVVASGVRIPLTFIYCRVQNLDEAGSIYATMDIQKIRTWRDSLQAAGKGDFPLATKVMPAIALIDSGFSFNSKNIEINSSRGRRFNRMDDYERPAELIADALRKAPSANVRLIQRAAIMAVALETARYQPSSSHAFWSAVARDDGLAKDRPEKALLSYMRNNYARGGTDNNIHAKAAALAWNAYFQRRNLEYCKPNAMGEFRLLGTPWSGPSPKPTVVTGISMNGDGSETKVTLFSGGENAHRN